MTNLEGRVIRRRKAVDAPPDVRSDLEILIGLATALGCRHGFEGMTAASVFDELRRASSGGTADYAGLSWRRIEESDGVFWPCPTAEHAGTPRLFADRFATASGRARFHPTPHLPIADPRDEEFPLLLTTGRLLAQYQSGTQTRRVEALTAVSGEPLAEIHPATAARAGVRDGQRLQLTTRRGAAVFTAKLTRSIREDTIFVPFHWGGPLAINRLTNAAPDPVSRMPEFKVCAVRVDAVDGGLS
jgi:assimilatory nitrate reductase catalytic subunit